MAGKVVLITGAARGQGRSHAIRLAEEGADIIAVDICQDYESLRYSLATADDLADTARQVESLGRRIIASQADVRDRSKLAEVVDAAVEEFGQLDVVVANAGVWDACEWDAVTPQVWQDVIDTNLTGVWNTVSVSASHLINSGGGSMICVSSTSGIKGLPFHAPYVASKHGVVGITRTLANELAKHKIRVNSIHPTGVDTDMIGQMGVVESMIAGSPDMGPLFMNSLPVEVLEPVEISNTVLFLASDESKYVTGLQLTVDAGNTIR